MNSTVVGEIEAVNGVVWFFIGCVAALVLLSLVLFGSVKKDTWCFTFGKFIKIKIMRLCCCRRAVEKNATELKEIIQK